MNDQYKKDEKIIKDIISSNVKITDHNKRLKIVIYYRNCKVKNLMKNNITHKNYKLSTSKVVYMRYNALVETARSPTPRILDKPGI